MHDRDPSRAALHSIPVDEAMECVLHCGQCGGESEQSNQCKSDKYLNAQRSHRRIIQHVLPFHELWPIGFLVLLVLLRCRYSRESK
jgi:hypothetical protein